MKVLAVSQRSYEAGVQLADLDSVKAALLLYMEGGTRGSRATESRLMQDSTGDRGVVAVTMGQMLKNGNRQNKFLADLFERIDTDMAATGRFYRSYDYDGSGTPFFKTTVQVVKVQHEGQEIHTLSLNAAYVGDQPTAGLAEAIHASRALWRDEVVVTLAPEQDQFHINFDKIVSNLPRLGASALTGLGLATQLMQSAQNSRRDSVKSVVVSNDQTRVNLFLDWVGYPFDFHTNTLTWVQEGAIIRGPLEKSREAGRKFSDPELSFSISAARVANVDDWDRPPVVDPDLKDRIHQQAQAIARAFQ